MKSDHFVVGGGPNFERNSLSFSLPLSLSPSLPLSFSLSLFLSFSLSLLLSFSLSLCLSVSLSFWFCFGHKYQGVVCSAMEMGQLTEIIGDRFALRMKVIQHRAFASG